MTAIWIDLEGGKVLVNSAKGRVKNRVMEVGAKVVLSIVDPENSCRFIRLQSVVGERRDAGAGEQLERLSQRSLGKPYPWRWPGEERELFAIRPTHVQVMGPAHFSGTGSR